MSKEIEVREAAKDGKMSKKQIKNFFEAIEKLPKVQVLPNGIDLDKLQELLMFSKKYEISIQFWPDQIAVFISKDGVELQDYGSSFLFAVSKSIEYLNRITDNNKRK